MKLQCTITVLAALFCLNSYAFAFSDMRIDTPAVHLVLSPKIVGDILPATGLPKWIGNEPSKLTVYDHLKTKRVILDFFATWCIPCIRALDKLDSLQQLNHDKLDVIVVAYEKKAIIEKFLANNPVGKKIKLPFIIEDTALSLLFPHAIIPHEVWLEQNGKIAAITADTAVTGNNLHDFFTEKRLYLTLKNEITDFNSDKPLFENGNGGSPNQYLARSILARTDPGLGGRTRIVPGPHGTISRIMNTNISPIGLFYIAFCHAKNIPGNLNPKRMIIESEYAANQLKGGHYYDPYTYELTLPAPVSPALLGSYMMEDLNRYFSINGIIEKRVRPCWVIKTLDKSKLRADQPSSAKAGYYNITMEIFKKLISGAFEIEPVFMDENINPTIKLNINVEALTKNEYPDIPSLQKDLEAQGFTLSKENRESSVLVLKDK